jgi:hypothetical protein
MLARNRRLAMAGLIAAAAIAVPTGAFASESGSPSAKPTSPPACAGPTKSAAPGKSAAPSRLPQMAAAAGISADRLQAGLIAMKRAGGDTPAGIAAFAASADVTNSTAQQIADDVFGTQPAVGSPSLKPASPQPSADQTGRK